ncbi:MAG: hypothetical protein EBY17_24920, partial [Acidobacteriia bacterium]|nr:hypothetical protein [Terriglobia bacterium]
PVEFDGFRKLARLNSFTLTRGHFFGGMSIEETAEVLQVSTVTVTRDWQVARIGRACIKNSLEFMPVAQAGG